MSPGRKTNILFRLLPRLRFQTFEYTKVLGKLPILMHQWFSQFPLYASGARTLYNVRTKFANLRRRNKSKLYKQRTINLASNFRCDLVDRCYYLLSYQRAHYKYQNSKLTVGRDCIKSGGQTGTDLYIF